MSEDTKSKADKQDLENVAAGCGGPTPEQGEVPEADSISDPRIIGTGPMAVENQDQVLG